MSHITCPKCGSNEHISGYGFAAGPLGGYTFCEGCDAILELMPDLDGLDDDRAAEIQASANEALHKTWGDKSP